MLSIDELHALYPRAPEAYIDAFAQQSDDLFERFDIGQNANRLQFFLAQIDHESGGLTVTAENLNYSAQRLCEVWPKRFPTIDAANPYARNPEALANVVYCSRMGNGPEESGDGWRYRGRGYIQITGRDGYENVGQIAGLDLLGNPDLATEPEHALLVACGFWSWKQLNDLCDTGDFVKVTIRINGGTNGMADRRAWLDKVRRTLASPPPLADHPSTEEVISVQRALQTKGYREVGAADGVIAPRTIAAITRFRQQNGLGDGLIDDQLKAALGISD